MSKTRPSHTETCYNKFIYMFPLKINTNITKYYRKDKKRLFFKHFNNLKDSYINYKRAEEIFCFFLLLKIPNCYQKHQIEVLDLHQKYFSNKILHFLLYKNHYK